MDQPSPPAATTARTLVLMRHAAAGGAARDHDRPLTADGVRAATEAGRWIRANLPPVDFALCSTAVRTRQTLAAAGLAGAVRYSDELYGGGVDDILDQLATVPGPARTTLIVGHAPTIPSTAWELVTRARLADGRDDDAGARADDDQLRRFAAGTFAVLTTRADWWAVAEAGAVLQSVHHPVA